MHELCKKEKVGISFNAESKVNQSFEKKMALYCLPHSIARALWGILTNLMRCVFFALLQGQQMDSGLIIKSLLMMKEATKCRQYEPEEDMAMLGFLLRDHNEALDTL